MAWRVYLHRIILVVKYPMSLASDSGPTRYEPLRSGASSVRGTGDRSFSFDVEYTLSQRTLGFVSLTVCPRRRVEQRGNRKSNRRWICSVEFVVISCSLWIRSYANRSVPLSSSPSQGRRIPPRLSPARVHAFQENTGRIETIRCIARRGEPSRVVFGMGRECRRLRSFSIPPSSTPTRRGEEGIPIGWISFVFCFLGTSPTYDGLFFIGSFRSDGENASFPPFQRIRFPAGEEEWSGIGWKGEQFRRVLEHSTFSYPSCTCHLRFHFPEKDENVETVTIVVRVNTSTT